MAFRVGRRAHVRSRGRRRKMACQVFGARAVLSTWWSVKSPAASLRRLPPPPIQPRGVGLRRLPKPPPIEPGVRRVPLSGPSPAAARSAPQGELPLSIAVVIDGFSASPRMVGELIAELRLHGEVSEKRLIEPRRREIGQWQSCLDSNNIELVPVARGGGGERGIDHVCNEARKLLRARRVGAVALLITTSASPAPLVEEIIAAGSQCFVKSPSRAVVLPHVRQLLERAGAQILACECCQPDKARLMKYVCILQSDGTGCIKRLSDMPSDSLPSSDLSFNLRGDLASRLCKLDYQSSSEDPLIPSIAKFWFNNGLGELIVYPSICALSSMDSLFREHPDGKWVLGCRDLAFVFPYANARVTASNSNEYGSKKCATYVKAGVGPMVLRDSPTMVGETLCKMGFVRDDDSSECFEEVLDVFANLGGNVREMMRTDTQFVDSDTAHEKVDKIRRLLLSDSFTGGLQVPPSDAEVRTFLKSTGLLRSDSAPSKEVFLAMASTLSSAGLAPKRTYNGRVLQCLDMCSRRQRSMRQ